MDCNYLKRKSCIKDAQHKLLWANREFLTCVGAKSLDSILNLTDRDLPWQEYADIYKQHETDTLSGYSYSTLQPVKDGKGNNFIGFITKSLKVDKNCQKLIHTTFTEIANINIIQLIQTLIKYNNYVKNPSYAINKPLFNLSPRESECLFYLLRGKSSKLIAKILNISPRTVEQYIENIKNKLNCRNKSEIIDTALNLGLMYVIPSNLLQKTSILAESLKD